MKKSRNWNRIILGFAIVCFIATMLVAGYASAQSRVLQRSPMIFENAVIDTTVWTETLAAASTLTGDDCGKTMYLSSATEFATTLPPVASVRVGCEMDFVISAAAASANYTVLTGNSLENLIFGLISVNSTMVACADEDTITLVDGNAIGDHVSLKTDGTSWFITGEGITAAKLTCTQAD